MAAPRGAAVAVLGRVCVDPAFAVLLLVGRAGVAVAVPAKTRVRLGADADDIADLDAALGLRSDADRGADNLVPDDTRVGGSALNTYALACCPGTNTRCYIPNRSAVCAGQSRKYRSGRS